MNKKKAEAGNNKCGRSGNRRCEVCRHRKSKVISTPSSAELVRYRELTSDNASFHPKILVVSFCRTRGLTAECVKSWRSKLEESIAKKFGTKPEGYPQDQYQFTIAIFVFG